jgi:hypothetical protein
MKKINIYINIAVVGSVNKVLNNLINRIKESKLYDNCDKINLIINGSPNLLVLDLSDKKYKIFNPNSNIFKCEFPTLKQIWEDSKSNDNYILYLHTKGVTKPNHPNIEDWTNYLAYFNINKWEDRIKELEEYDCTGVNFFGNPEDLKLNPATWGYGKAPQHYSGNFWWSKSEHIRKLPNPMTWPPNDNYSRWRVMCEMWLCQSQDSKYYNAYSSDVDHYMNRYPKELYEKD